MKRSMRNLFLAVLLPGVFLLNACGANDQAEPTRLISDIETSAARTVTFKAVSAQSTLIFRPTSTRKPPTPTPTPRYPLHYFASVTPFSPSPQPTGALCHNSAHVADVTFPDHSLLEPGQVFQKTWTLQNIGTCGWTGSFTLNPVYGDYMNGATTAIEDYVLPQHQIQVTVCLIAPNGPGEYLGYWQLANDLGVGFGVRLTVLIDVRDTATGTPTPMPTPGCFMPSTRTPTRTPHP